MPEPTQLEHLPDASSFLGKLLVLQANFRLDWKVIAKYKCSSLIGLGVSYEWKKFYNIDTYGQCYKTFYGCKLMPFHNKLECLSLASLANLV